SSSPVLAVYIARMSDDIRTIGSGHGSGGRRLPGGRNGGEGMAKPARHWIDGEWLESSNGARAASLNPGTGEMLGEFADAGPADAEPAIAAARRVFDRGDWRRRPRLRAAVLLELADRLDAARPELAKSLAAENGKLIGDCMHEIAGAASELRYYAGLARNIF